ncbi:MAG: glycosyltransferase [Myxococcales bacterium]|nr:MAG: glycosyltransferase [Myxococcales bacterium]
MKILFVVDNLGAGGAERSLQELLVPFARSGIVPIVACFSRRREGVEHLLKDHDVRFLPGARRAAQMRELRRIAREERVDLVHTTLFEADVFGRPALLGLGVPIVTSLVNMPYEPARLQHDRRVNAVKLGAARALEIATGFACADHFHAISEAVKDAAAERLWIPRRKVSVVLRGRDPGRLGRRSSARRQRVRAELGLADDSPVVISVGRQEFQKGHGFLIEAMAQVRAVNPAAQLLIVGRAGSATDSLREAASKLGDGVRFLGHREDVPDLMAAADVFALPSLWEGLGCVLIEAMALELPIVASSLAPVKEVVLEHATLVPPAQAGPLAAALSRTLGGGSDVEARVVAARRRFEDALTIDKSAEQMRQLFERARREHAASGRA